MATPASSDPAPTPPADMSATDWDERYRSSGAGLLWSSGPNVFVAEHLSDLTPGRALDVAAGEGRNAVWLARRGWAVTATDVSPLALDRAAEQAAAAGVDLDLRVADVTAAPPPGGPYDVVLVSYLQLTAPALERALTHAVAAVAPGGTFLLVAHHVDNLAHGHGGPRDPGNLVSPEQVLAHLGGFTVHAAGARQRPVDGAPRPAIDTVVLATRPAAAAAERGQQGGPR